jgi:ADP-ribosylglycohydrolase
MSVPRAEQFSGCLVGQCLGHALGFPVEACLPRTTRAYVEKILRKSLAGSWGRQPYPFGQYTDDSQLARELMLSFVDCGQFDPADYARRLTELFVANRIVGPGGATSEAARRLAQGVPWDKAGTPPPSAGNGSAMRAAPVGLFFYDDANALIQAAHEQGSVTHQDSRCSAGAVAIAGGVALALTCETIEPSRFLNQLSDWVERTESSVAEWIQRLETWLALPPEQAVVHISIAGLQPRYSDWYVGITPFVMGSVLWSLYAFLRTPEEYWETICTAIWPGGDVDTTAAMAGAISGAHLGLEALPADLAHRVTDQGTWGYDELVGLADRCYEIKIKGEGCDA